jgi:hypothetical protein
LRELENISTNWNSIGREEILKFLKLRMELTKESIQLEKLNFIHLKKNSKIQIKEKKVKVEVEKFYKFQLLHHQIVDIIEMENEIEKIGNFKRCFISVSRDGTEFIGIISSNQSKIPSKMEWSNYHTPLKYENVLFLNGIEKLNLLDEYGEFKQQEMMKLYEKEKLKSKL